MRELVLEKLRDWYDENGLTFDDFGDEVVDFKTEVETMNDEELLNLFQFTVSRFSDPS